MPLKDFLLRLEGLGFITRKPKPAYVFLLFFAYLLIWIVILVIYLKYRMEILKFWIIAIGILTAITLAHALIHRYIVKILGEVKDDKEDEI